MRFNSFFFNWRTAVTFFRAIWDSVAGANTVRLDRSVAGVARRAFCLIVLTLLWDWAHVDLVSRLGGHELNFFVFTFWWSAFDRFFGDVNLDITIRHFDRNRLVGLNVNVFETNSAIRPFTVVASRRHADHVSVRTAHGAWTARF